MTPSTKKALNKCNTRQAVKQDFDIATECAGTAARLMTYQLDFQDLASTDTSCISKEVVAKQLTDALVNAKDLQKEEVALQLQLLGAFLVNGVAALSAIMRFVHKY